MAPRPEYPRPNLRREAWVNLNGEWEFGAGEKPVFDRRIVVPFCPESQLSGLGEMPGDVVWYRRRFEAPTAERLALHFGAVDYRATVWVNGVEATRHEGGHTPFSADISGLVHKGDNVVVVRAEDPLTDKTIPRGKQFWGDSPEGIFYTATTGIWQTVWLEPLPVRHIESLRMSPDLAAGAVEFELRGQGSAELSVTFEGEIVGAWSGEPGRGRIALEHVSPWRPGKPELYEVEATLLDPDGKMVDRVETYFGLRTVECKDGRFWLNGEPFVQRLILDQGYFPGGLMTAGAAETLRHDIKAAAALGFNGARKHQKVEDPLWLYYADVYGFLVWSEMPSFQAHSVDAERRLATEWAEVMRRDRGHPSVVAWVPANESFGLQHVDPALRSRFLVRLYELTHELDPTRPVVSNDGWEHAITDLCTLHNYSGPEDFARRYRMLEATLDGTGSGHRPFDPGFDYRGQPILVTEFGGVQMSGSGGWGYRNVEGGEQFLNYYRGLIAGLMDQGPIQGFCYTQLTDVEQEKNGLLTFDREPKVAPELVSPITQTPKVH